MQVAQSQNTALRSSVKKNSDFFNKKKQLFRPLVNWNVWGGNSLHPLSLGQWPMGHKGWTKNYPSHNWPCPYWHLRITGEGHKVPTNSKTRKTFSTFCFCTIKSHFRNMNLHVGHKINIDDNNSLSHDLCMSSPPPSQVRVGLRYGKRGNKVGNMINYQYFALFWPHFLAFFNFF